MGRRIKNGTCGAVEQESGIRTFSPDEDKSISAADRASVLRRFDQLFKNLDKKERARFIRLEAAIMLNLKMNKYEVAYRLSMSVKWVERVARLVKSGGALWDGRRENGKDYRAGIGYLSAVTLGRQMKKDSSFSLGWTSQELASWLSSETGRPVSPQKAWQVRREVRLALAGQKFRPDSTRKTRENKFLEALAEIYDSERNLFIIKPKASPSGLTPKA